MTSISFMTAALRTAATAAARIVERKTTIPILGHLRIWAGIDQCIITSTDLDIEAQIQMNSVQSGAGGFDCCLPAHILHDILRKLDDGVVTLKSDSGRITLTQGRSRFLLNALAPEDFPTLDAGEFDCRFEIAAATLAEAISLVSHAISTEETRYYLNGIHLAAMGSNLVAVATDGHQLSRFTVPLPEGSANLPPIIIPRKTAQELLRQVDGIEGDVVFEASSQKMRVTCGDTTITSKLIDGTYPDFERVIPKQFSGTATVKKDPFSQALERVASVSVNRARGTLFEFGASGTTIKAAAEGNEAEDGVESSLEGNPLSIGLNSTFVENALGKLAGDDIRISFNDAGSPVSMIGKDERHLCIIMPMRV